MLKRIKKLIPSPRFTVPIMGLAVAVGAVSQRVQPVFSQQIARLQPMTSSEISEPISKEARLRRALDTSASMEVSPGKTYTWIQRSTDFNSENSTRELESLSNNQARIGEDKPSIKGAIPKANPNNNGVFLYGSSPQRGEFGRKYIIFDKQGSKVVGAMYMPASEFNCFAGALDRSGEIAMTVKGYAGDISPNQVASTSTLPKINEDEPINYAYSVTLQDYHRIGTVSEEESNILRTCKANFQ